LSVALLAAMASLPSQARSRKKPKGVVPMLEQGCKSMQFQACVTLGSYYEQGLEGVKEDPMRAASLYDKACKGKLAEGCSALAALEKLGKAGAVDLSRAAQLQTQACEGGSNKACVELGRAYLQGQGVKKDAARAQGLFHRACEARDALGCYYEGAGFEKGVVTLKDQQQAAVLNEK
jgi:TPR repeat protein